MAEPAPAARPGASRGTWRAVVAPPNLISLVRIPLAAAYLLVETSAVRAAILVAAAASDYLDGWAARRFGAGTGLGEILDPITDKTFLVTAIAAHFASGDVSAWQLALLLVRDAYSVLAFGAAAAMRLPIEFRARMSGKIVTSLQIAAVLVLVMLPAATAAAVWCVTGASIWAIFDYTMAGLRGLRRNGSAG